MRVILMSGMLASAAVFDARAQCTGNLNNDGAIDGIDLGALLGSWGPCIGACSADLNADGNVNGIDLGLLLGGWGTCPGAPTWATVLEWLPDPQVVSDATIRHDIAATGRPWRVRDIGTGIELLLVPPGAYPMGCAGVWCGWGPESEYPCEADEIPRHVVAISQPFYMGRYEVTQAQWQAAGLGNPSQFQGYPDSSARPVERVTWNALQEFLVATGTRLPTEAEWEYAYRAGTTTVFHGFPGNPAGFNCWQQASAIGVFGGCAPGAPCSTLPVGQREGNGFGIHDMSGNVWEWVSDWYQQDYYSTSPSVDPQGPTIGQYRVMRGGGWGNLAWGGRGSTRWRMQPEGDFSSPNSSGNEIGFRIARIP